VTVLVTVERSTHAPTPADETIQAWITAALATASTAGNEPPEICIRITDIEEATRFNEKYRSKPRATNVLSFPAELPPGTPSGLLGDLVICAPVVRSEAKQQHKREEAHWAHMIIHGVLHLLGHDHKMPADAEIMEALEVQLLERFCFPNPYELTEPLEGAQP
jgi:probable rRNA maturation factor